MVERSSSEARVGSSSSYYYSLRLQHASFHDRMSFVLKISSFWENFWSNANSTPSYSDPCGIEAEVAKLEEIDSAVEPDAPFPNVSTFESGA